MDRFFSIMKVKPGQLPSVYQTSSISSDIKETANLFDIPSEGEKICLFDRPDYEKGGEQFAGGSKITIETKNGKLLIRQTL